MVYGRLLYNAYWLIWHRMIEQMINMTVFGIPKWTYSRFVIKPSLNMTIGLYDTFPDSQQFHINREFSQSIWGFQKLSYTLETGYKKAGYKKNPLIRMLSPRSKSCKLSSVWIVYKNNPHIRALFSCTKGLFISGFQCKAIIVLSREPCN